jgi:hypothetical protein
MEVIRGGEPASAGTQYAGQRFANAASRAAGQPPCPGPPVAVVREDPTNRGLQTRTRGSWGVGALGQSYRSG